MKVLKSHPDFGFLFSVLTRSARKTGDAQPGLDSLLPLLFAEDIFLPSVLQGLQLPE
ncbi:hypothetical protein FQN60_000682 [Etheostoma spectabile]|uniref:Uncharacterized protein n=1 Tax=Etheostoma spectabile TaxID=54343 RepID=A0A5J5D2B4_9PERO|nr:hypothetical protein FQN60_000682 [Etheostoma spectabile]